MEIGHHSRISTELIAIPGVDHQRQPDEAEADHAVRGEAFTVEQHADQELKRRRNVLQHAQAGQRDLARAVGEKQERHRGDHA